MELPYEGSLRKGKHKAPTFFSNLPLLTLLPSLSKNPLQWAEGEPLHHEEHNHLATSSPYTSTSTQIPNAYKKQRKVKRRSLVTNAEGACLAFLVVFFVWYLYHTVKGARNVGVKNSAWGEDDDQQ